MSLRNVSLNASTFSRCRRGCLINIVGDEVTLVPAHEFGDDVSWLLNCAFLVVSMQLGFAMLEVGSVRKAHRMTILAKNVLDSTVSILGFWAFCEYRHSKLVADSKGEIQSHLVLFHSAFCGAAVTICGGSMAERAHMNAYMFFAVLMSLLIYPEIADGAWTDSGALSANFHQTFTSGYKFHDFAGSGVVHMTGGCCALVGNLFLGRRIMKTSESLESPSSSSNSSPLEPYHGVDMRRVDRGLDNMEAQLDGEQANRMRTNQSHAPASPGNGLPYALHLRQESQKWQRRFEDTERDKSEFESSSQYLQVMGMFTLWVGWYGFNTGSVLSLYGVGNILAGQVAMNTTLAACAGGLGSYLFCYYTYHRLDLSFICNGVISGLIAITAPCDVSTRISSAMVGFIAGVVLYPLFHNLTAVLKLDDPVDAIAVHAGAGLFGVLVVPFCGPDCSFFSNKDLTGFDAIAHFCAKDYSIGSQLAQQTWGALVIIAYSCGISILVWGLPAVSECVLAIEDERLERVSSILINIALNQQPDTEQQMHDLVEAVQQSHLAPKILRQHGWVNNRFEKPEQNEPIHLLQVWRHMKDEQNAKLKSALEILQWRTCILFASLIRFCHLPTLCFFRLRILPASELSGLGSADIVGGWVLKRVKKLIKREADKGANNKLRKELDQLHALMHGQEALLRTLMIKRGHQLMPECGHATPSSPGTAVSASSYGVTSIDKSMERAMEASLLNRAPSSPGESNHSTLYRLPQPIPAEGHPDASPQLVSLPRGPRGSPSSGISNLQGSQSEHDSTHSPTYSYHSAGELASPPPSVLGRTRQLSAADVANRPYDIEDINVIASQLSAALERHQNFAQESPAPRGGSSEISTPKSGSVLI